MKHKSDSISDKKDFLKTLNRLANDSDPINRGAFALDVKKHFEHLDARIDKLLSEKEYLIKENNRLSIEKKAIK